MSVKTYDPKCHELALAFLVDFPKLNEERRAKYAHAMACEIQSAIEDYIAAEDLDLYA